MADGSDYILDVAGVEGESAEESPPAKRVRPWIGMQFDCCGCYSRIYKNAKGTAYLGNCPRCGRSVRIRVGPDGTNHRFFRYT
jgi:hypothetical protein